MFPSGFPSPLVQPSGTRRVLLAEMRLNRSALYIDLLNVFSAAYDTYDVIGEGLYPSTADRINIQFAVNGVVDTGANYAFSNYSAGQNATASSFGYLTNDNVQTTGRGLQFEMRVLGANSINGHKRYIAMSAAQGSTAEVIGMTQLVYTPATPISGIRFKWESANTFQGKGTVLVYGNTRY